MEERKAEEKQGRSSRSKGGRGSKKKGESPFWGWVIPLGILLLWWIWGNGNEGASRFLPTIPEVGKGLRRLIENGTLTENIRISTVRALKGLAVGGLIGFTLGVINGIWEKANALLNNPIQMVRNVPYLAMMPLILVWFGIGENTKTILIAIGTFFPIYLNTYAGIRFIDPSLLEMARVYRMGKLDLFCHVVFPGALPSILIGIKQSLGRMWVILIVAEEIAARSGIGYMITNAREYMLMDVIVVGLILYALLGWLSDSVMTLLERWLLRWRRA